MLRLLCAPILGLALAAAAPAPAARDSDEAFTQRMVERFRAALPDAVIVVEGPLQFTLRAGPDAEPFEVTIGGVRRGCLRDPTNCEAETAYFVTQTVLIATEAAPPPVTRATLRLAVRGRDYCASILDTMARMATANPARQGAAPGVLLMRDLPPDLCMLVMSEHSGRRHGVTEDDLRGPGLGVDEAWGVAKRQTLETLPPPGTIEGLGPDRIIALNDTEYAPTLLLDTEAWRPVAAAHGGLIIAVPSDNMIIIADPATRDLAALRQSVRRDFEAADLGISPNLYRWTEAGWVVAE